MKVHPIIRIVLFAVIAALTTAPLMVMANNPEPPTYECEVVGE